MKRFANASERTAAVTKIIGEVAKTSAEQTKTALHVSQRAYITTDTPTLDITTKVISFGISNTGRIPSGNIEAVVHAATINSEISNRFTPESDTTSEFNWRRHLLSPLPPGKDLITLAVPIPNFSEFKYAPQGVYQLILFSGRVVYDDGFSDDGQQEWPFCYQTTYHVILKRIFLVPCSAARWIPVLERRDGYPRNEQTD